jgi:hypothetical protein
MPDAASSDGMTWGDDDLNRIGHAAELQLASRRPDGTLRAYVTLWVVRVGDRWARRPHGHHPPGAPNAPRLRRT